MNAGRELDALIAEKVMGWTETRRERHPMHEPGGGRILKECMLGNPPDGSSPAPLIRHIPHYSTDFAAAMSVVEKLLPDFPYPAMVRLTLEAEDMRVIDAWRVKFDINGIVAHCAEELPFAICLAALEAVAGDVARSAGQS